MADEESVNDFSKHEAVYATHLVTNLFNEEIEEHPFVQSTPELQQAAEEIGNQLRNFYQLIRANTD